MYGAVRILIFTMASRFTLALYGSFANSKRIAVSSTRSQVSKSSFSSVSDLRKEYSKQGLDESKVDVAGGPVAIFKTWLEDAITAEVLEPNAMCLSTCADNRPSARVVLLKSYDENGFVWFTNYNSKKAADLASNPYAALTFWWGPLERSVRIEGKVEKISEEESSAYFNSRPRGSQIGAWSSNQSSPIASREALQQQEQDVIARYEAAEQIPRPPHWGGFRLVPDRVEFWKGRESRLHDRLVFSRAEGTQWKLERLQP